MLEKITHNPYYSCNNRGQIDGVGFVMNKKMKQRVVGFENESQIVSYTFKGKVL